MQNIQMKPYVANDVADKMRAMGEHYGMSGNQLAALVLTEFSRVRKEGLFHALSSIPDDLKARPVGRPAGSTSTAKSEKTERVTAAA